MTRRVVVTGLGCVSGLGQGVAQSWTHAAAGKGAIGPLRRGDPTNPVWCIDGPAAAIEALDCTAAEARFGARALAQLDPLSLFAVVAGLEAMEDADLLSDRALDDRTAILLGCGSGGNATIDAAFYRLYARGLPKVHPQTIPTSMISAPASQLAMLFGIHGPTFTVASACASSAHAIGEAMAMIRAGRVEIAVAGGAEACLSPGSWVAWSSLGAMASDSCRPFSAERQGLVLGEGAAVLVLEERDRALARGAKIHGELLGYGATADAVHITAPDQAGVVTAVRAALTDAAIPDGAPALISSHGTGTLLNDRIEAAALREVWGEAVGETHIIATKSAHGHLIGGSGALELLLGLRALAEGIAPPILNYLGADPACDLPLVLTPTAHDHQLLVSNSFAFGGLNAVLVACRA